MSAGTDHFDNDPRWQTFLEAFLANGGNYKQAADAAGLESSGVYNRKNHSKAFQKWLKDAVDEAMFAKTIADKVRLSKVDSLDSAERQTMTLRFKMTGQLNDKTEIHVHNNSQTVVFSDTEKDEILEHAKRTGKISFNVGKN
jgi:hypothetical protein